MPPQTSNDSTSFDGLPGDDMDLGRGTNHKRVPSGDRSIDLKSTESISGSGNSTTPSSVILAASPFTRELSDLSGSYMNGVGSRGSKIHSVPGQIYDQAKGPWRQAYILSEIPPEKVERSVKGGADSTRDATIVVNKSDVVEIVDRVETPLDLTEQMQPQNHNRIPIMVLIMDGGRHGYELMQIWVDKSTDYIRDVVTTIQKSMPDKWKQDYDGIFQVRGNRFTQLIHILKVQKYDAQVNELFIAKPWSMTAKVTIAYATSAIRHLTSIGVIKTEEVDKTGRRVFRPKSEEAPLLLSKKAQERIYAPDGILTHHHAVQFITFSPPFDPYRAPLEIHDRDDGTSSIDSPGDTSGSRTRASSPNNVLSAIGAPSIAASPKSITHKKPMESVPEGKGGQAISQTDYSEDDADIKINPKRFDIARNSSPGRRRTFAQIVSKLNCCKGRDKVQNSKTTTTPKSSDSDEREKSWSGFDVRPVTEDMSVAGHSIVSMSAPLLSDQKSETTTGAVKQQ